MKLNRVFISFLIFSTLASLQMGMGRRNNASQYDEEARQAEREEHLRQKSEPKEPRKNPARNFAGGVKEATVDNATGLISDTAEGTFSDQPVRGTLEGVREGSGSVLDRTVKGVSKVATLGYGEVDNYQVQEPEKGTDQPTKIKIKIPGT